MKKYICPCCGFPDLDEPPYYDGNIPSHNICECCGIEFGYENTASYRKKWIENGCNWFSTEFKPLNWSFETQIKNISDDIN